MELSALDSLLCSGHKCLVLGFDPRATSASLLTPHTPIRMGSFKLIDRGGGLGDFPSCKLVNAYSNSTGSTYATLSTYFFFGMRDLSSLTRDGTRAPCSGSSGS